MDSNTSNNNDNNDLLESILASDVENIDDDSKVNNETTEVLIEGELDRSELIERVSDSIVINDDYRNSEKLKENAVSRKRYIEEYLNDLIYRRENGILRVFKKNIIVKGADNSTRSVDIYTAIRSDGVNLIINFVNGIPQEYAILHAFEISNMKGNYGRIKVKEVNGIRYENATAYIESCNFEKMQSKDMLA